MKTEIELVAEARRGCKDSFEKLVSIHKTMVYNLVRGKAPDAAEDLTQEIFIKVYYNLEKFRGESSFKTWLVRISINHVNNYLRKIRFKEFLFWDHDFLKHAKSSGKEAMPGDISLHLKEELMNLTSKHREVVVLHDILGFEYKEIAEILRLPIGTVRSRLYYARKKLRESILREG